MSVKSTGTLTENESNHYGNFGFNDLQGAKHTKYFHREVLHYSDRRVNGVWTQSAPSPL